jgi:hypothetical protein
MTSSALHSPTGGGSAPQAGHPAPERGHVALSVLWFGLLAAPLAWSLQLLVNYAFAAHACFPRYVPLAYPIIGQGALTLVLIVVSVVTIAIGVLALYMAIHTWRRTSKETGGGSHWLLDTGEGRTRFMAASGIMTSALFLLSMIVHLVAVLVLGYCG